MSDSLYEFLVWKVQGMVGLVLVQFLLKPIEQAVPDFGQHPCSAGFHRLTKRKLCP